MNAQPSTITPRHNPRDIPRPHPGPAASPVLTPNPRSLDHHHATTGSAQAAAHHHDTQHCHDQHTTQHQPTARHQTSAQVVRRAPPVSLGQHLTVMCLLTIGKQRSHYAAHLEHSTAIRLGTTKTTMKQRSIINQISNPNQTANRPKKSDDRPMTNQYQTDKDPTGPPPTHIQGTIPVGKVRPSCVLTLKSIFEYKLEVMTKG